MSCMTANIERVHSSVLCQRVMSFLHLEETTRSYCTLERKMTVPTALLERIRSEVFLQKQLSTVVLERVCGIFQDIWVLYAQDDILITSDGMVLILENRNE